MRQVYLAAGGFARYGKTIRKEPSFPREPASMRAFSRKPKLYCSATQ